MRSLKISKQITERNTNSFEKYLQDVARKTKTQLTPEDEVKLAEQIKSGDKIASERAAKELVEKNLKFVISVAKQYQHIGGCEIEDLVSEGNLGLIKAAKRFDSTKGFKFISYAVWWIRQSILYHLSENSSQIRMPLNRISQLSKIKRVKEKLEQEFNRKPTIDEIIEHIEFKITDDEINKMFLAEIGTFSLNNTVSPDKNNSGTESFTTFEDLIENDESQNTDTNIEKEDIKIVVNFLINKLPPKHRLIIQMYYGLNSKNPISID
ncbi:MAG: sigma-70 family RNA polymerase sigma factor, partial [Candidatus Izemoplasmatales bacterium]